MPLPACEPRVRSGVRCVDGLDDQAGGGEHGYGRAVEGRERGWVACSRAGWVGNGGTQPAIWPDSRARLHTRLPTAALRAAMALTQRPSLVAMMQSQPPPCPCPPPGCAHVRHVHGHAPGSTRPHPPPCPCPPPGRSPCGCASRPSSPLRRCPTPARTCVCMCVWLGEGQG